MAAIPGRSMGVIVANMTRVLPGTLEVLAPSTYQELPLATPKAALRDLLERLAPRGEGWEVWRGPGGLLAVRGGLAVSVTREEGGLRVGRGKLTREGEGELVKEEEVEVTLDQLSRVGVCQGRGEEQVLPLLAAFPSPRLLTALFLIERVGQVGCQGVSPHLSHRSMCTSPGGARSGSSLGRAPPAPPAGPRTGSCVLLC